MTLVVYLFPLNKSQLLVPQYLAKFLPLPVMDLEQAYVSGTRMITNSQLFSMGKPHEIQTGATAWLLRQCNSLEAAPCNRVYGLASIAPPKTSLLNLNKTGVKHTSFHAPDGEQLDMAILYCVPFAQIMTFEVLSDGHGNLLLGDKMETSQRNLDPAVVNLTLSFIFNGIEEAGPPLPFDVPFGAFGNELQFNLLFGKLYNENTESLLTGQLFPQSLNDITAAYGQIIRSASKSFLTGTFGITYVPARRTEQMLVFHASLQLVIVATVLYLVCSVATIFFYFRPRTPQFTFVSVATSLSRSDIPTILTEGAEDQELPGEDPPALLKDVGVVLKDRRLVMVEHC